MPRSHLPLLLAAIITLLNAVKPAVVDDTAYLLFARHLAVHPLDPYGFDLFWYVRPEPAMDIILPPVLPYWLAGGIALFGEHLSLLKLWLFPFAWVLCLSVRSLLRRFAAGVETPGLVAFALSPAVLPLFSFMLDVPALALGAAAVALFVNGCDGGRAGPVVLAAACTALAMQTKYTMLSVPCVLLAYGFTRLGRPGSVRAMLFAVVAACVGVGLFAAWEWYLVQLYGKSHFLLHLKGSAGEGGDVWNKLAERLAFAPPLLGQFGGLACGVSLAAGAGVGWSRRVRVAAAVGLGVLLAAVCLLPYSATAPLGRNFDLSNVLFLACGASVVATAAFGLGRVFLRRAADADTLFLVGWVMVETAGMLGMTPFPAARRVIGVCLAMAVLLLHLVAKLRAVPKVAGTLRVPTAARHTECADYLVPRWAVGFAVGLGLLVWAVDCWDALPEKVLAEQASEMTKPAPGETVWFTGHWGFQYYCDRAGMRHLVPWKGGTPMRAGDWLVIPVPPPRANFYRPCPYTESDHEPLFPRVDMLLEEVAELEWRDALSGQTVPNLYGGGAGPLKGRDHPRLRVAVYRVMRDWKP